MYRIVLDSLPDMHDEYTLYDCKTENGVDATVWLVPGQDVEASMTVEATLEIVHHPASVAPDGTFFPSFTEYRLLDANRHR